jgi:hypothetical protein
LPATTTNGAPGVASAAVAVARGVPWPCTGVAGRGAWGEVPWVGPAGTGCAIEEIEQPSRIPIARPMLKFKT